MGTMLDLPAALRAAGLTVWVAPDWRTNGHGYDLIKPFGGVLHHTAGHGLRSVYGEPDARPDVPQPRCNLWTPRPGTQPYDIAVICAGRAWQAGTGRMAAYDRMRAGNFSVRTPDAAALYGRDSDDVDAGWTSEHTLGNEVEWNTGDPWTDRHLDVVATAMHVCADVLGWPGVGCWANHRQLTWRKPDMDYRGDIWTRAANLANPQEDDVTPDEVKAAVRDVLHLPDSGLAVPGGQTDNGKLAQMLVGNIGMTYNAVNAVKGAVAAVKADTSVQGDDEAKILAKLAELQRQLDALASPTPPAGA
jgi:hypothetical protein